MLLLLNKARKQLEDIQSKLPLVLDAEESTCGSGHPVVVIRKVGEIFGGLVVAHLDGHHSDLEFDKLIGLITPEFINALESQGFFDDPFWSYAEYVSPENDTGAGIQIVRMFDPNLFWNSTTNNLVPIAA